MLIGVTENGAVEIFEDLAAALADWGHPVALLSGEIVLYDEDGVWFQPIERRGPRRWLGLVRGALEVELRRNPDPGGAVDPIGLALDEASTLRPNRHFESLERLRERYPFERSPPGSV